MRRLIVPTTTVLLLSACGRLEQGRSGPDPEEKPTAARARAFVERVDAELKAHLSNWERAEWIKQTHLTHDTEWMAAHFHEQALAYRARVIQEATRFDPIRDQLDADTQRQLRLLKVSQSMPAPDDPEKRKRLAELSAKLASQYSTGKYCTDAEGCRTLQDLSRVLVDNKDWNAQLAAWKGWRTISIPMRPLYAEFVGIANAGAQELGFDNLGELWRAGYDMTPAEFEAESERLWNQVKPLYEQLHCYVRAKLAEHYGQERIDPDGPLPAHVLGNMWAQEWMTIYPLVEPYAGSADIDVTAALVRKGYDAQRMVRLAERFFTSLGLDPLPETFWERSQFTKPADREVECHASAWDVAYNNDLRIKMCIQIDESDLITTHHELGHNYYYMYYHRLPVLYQQGAHDGFHEGIGDTLALSVTPGYLKEVGILDRVESDHKALINLQMKEALDKIAFLPFGKLIDQWRWDVFAGKATPADYNARWWVLRRRYQGVAPPVPRSEADFDPGAKYHIPANVPYARYFLARILQFQFHRALCQAAGHQGPLHTCSIYGSQEAGQKMRAMLQLGASKPWPDALQAMTGTRRMDATALIDYFEPLMTWLRTENAERTCGW